MSKATRATLKSFIRKNIDRLLVGEFSRFDGMHDCVMPIIDCGFTKADVAEHYHENNMGISGVWCVGEGRDYIQPFEKDGLRGFDVSNCCGHFAVAVAV